MTEPWGNIVYNATITEETVSPLTVSLSNGATIVIAAGAFSGTTSVAVAADEDVYIDPPSINATISSTSGGCITVAIDSTHAATTITDTVYDTTLSLKYTPTLAEGRSMTRKNIEWGKSVA